jgi:hypothetical protein
VNARAGDPPDEQLRAAEADLARLRESLRAAGRGELDAGELWASSREYLEQHGPVIRGVAATVGEEVRRQLLAQLYGWRRQLDAQLGSGRGQR